MVLDAIDPPDIDGGFANVLTPVTTNVEPESNVAVPDWVIPPEFTIPLQAIDPTKLDVEETARVVQEADIFYYILIFL